MSAKKLYKKERFAGCLLGAAAGDALGSQVKTMTISQIKDCYGKKGVLKLVPEKHRKTARISDETQTMLFTVHGILWGDAAGIKTGEADCAKSGVLAEVRKREHYESPSVKRRKKSEAARKNRNKRYY